MPIDMRRIPGAPSAQPYAQAMMYRAVDSALADVLQALPEYMLEAPAVQLTFAAQALPSYNGDGSSEHPRLLSR